MYLFYAWLIKNQLFTLEQTWQVALCVYAWNILLAYLCLKFYDEPVRKYLAKRFLSKKTINSPVTEIMLIRTDTNTRYEFNPYKSA